MLLSIIVVSYNTKDLTIQTLKSAAADVLSSKLLKDKTEIFLVDNDSKDDSVKAAKAFSKKSKVPVIVIATGENLGFAKGNNVAVEKAKGKYIIFLNPDTIVKKGALETMVKRFENGKNEKLGVLASTLLNPDLTLQAQGGNFPSLPNLFVHMTMLDNLPFVGKFLPSTQHTGKNSKQRGYYEFDKVKEVHRKGVHKINSEGKEASLGYGEARESALGYNKLSPKIQPFSNDLINVDWVAGTAMMFSRKALDEFGSLDPNIFMYGEDVEICLRARNHHYEVAIDPAAQIIHLQSQSSTSENAIRKEFEGYLYIYSKHQNRLQTEIAKVFLQIGAILRIFVFSVIAPDSYKKQIYKNVLKDLS
jgi:GT2 family glycosyltransferase